MKSHVTTVIALALMFVSSTTYSRTWHIKLDGTGDAPTIQAGIDSALAGDDVLVAPGTYTWSNQGEPIKYLIRMKSGVWLHSEAGPEVTVLDGEDQSWSVVFCSGTSQAMVEGFTVTGGVNPGPCGYGGGGVYCGNDASVTIDGNIIVDNYATQVWEGSGGGGLFVGGVVNTIITNNVITGNYCDWNGGGICCWGSALIENNIIVDNRADADGGGIYVYGTGARIANNTIIGNSAPEGAGIRVRNALRISRNIIAGSLVGAALYCDATTSPAIFCNDLWDNQGGDGNCALGSDNFSADPMFCDPAAGDYHLHDDSPCAPHNSPAGCGLVGALPVGCWDAPVRPAVIVLILVGMGATGVRSIVRSRYVKPGRRD